MTRTLVVGTLGVLVSLLVACGPDTPEAAPVLRPDPEAATPASVVTAVRPTRESLEGLLEVPGTFYPDEEAVISTEATALVTVVHVEEGARAGRGELLVRLDDTKAQIAVQQAAAALAQAQANFEKARSELARKATLLEDRTISPAAFETFKAQHDSAAAAVDVATAALALGRRRLEDLAIAAPFAGVVKDKTVAPGEYVREGDRLLTLMRVDPLKLVFDLPEKHVARVSDRTEIRARTTALPGVAFRGSVRTIFPAIDVQTRTARVEARVANPDYRLRPGFYATVEVPLHSLPGSLVLPRGAVVTREGAESVFVLRGDRVELTRVQTGVQTPQNVEIVFGLADDAHVILSGVETLQPGDRVRVEGVN